MANEFGERLPADLCCLVALRFAFCDDAGGPLAAEIQSWFRRVVVMRDPACRRVIVEVLSVAMWKGDPASGPVLEISAELGAVLADDTDLGVRRAVGCWLLSAGVDANRDERPVYREFLPDDVTVDIITRLCRQRPRTSEDCTDLIDLVGGAALILLEHGLLDDLLMQVSAPLLAGEFNDEESCCTLANQLARIFDLLNKQVARSLLSFVIDHPNDEVRETWCDIRQMLAEQQHVHDEGLTEESDLAFDEQADVTESTRGGSLELSELGHDAGEFLLDIEAGQDLSGAFLRGARLAGHKLVGCNFTGADLTNADLRGARLNGALFYRAILTGALLDGADLSNATLSGADLRGASLFAVDACAASCIGTDLRGANLTAARFRAVNFQNADLRRARIDALDVYGAHLDGSSRDEGFPPSG